MRSFQSGAEFKHTALLTVVLIIWGIMFLRLFKLQILDYEVYIPLSDKNSLRQESMPPIRGLILDRHSTVLAENEPVFSLTITPINFDTTRIPLLAGILEMPEEELRERLNKAIRYSWHRSSEFVKAITFDRFSIVEENSWQLPGIGFTIGSRRHYPSDVKASHVLGYVREATQEDLASIDGLKAGDNVGKSGVELTYDDQLRGLHGYRVIRVNAMGQNLGAFNVDAGPIPPTRGSDLMLTIDANLQRLAETLLEGKKGAVVALDPTTGEILAMVSSPQPDLQRLAGILDTDYWAELNRDPDTPLFNRTVSARQPPGSTIKPLMGIIGMHMGIVSEREEIYNPGAYYRGRFYQDLAPVGSYDVEHAIVHSSNTYFLAVMDEIATGGNFNRWARYMNEFGLGIPTGVDLPSDVRALVPDSSSMDARFGRRRWGVGDVLNLGIGQGVFSVSPLQLAVATSVIANGGFRVRPHLVKGLIHPDGTMEETPLEVEPIEWMDPSYLRPVVKGMMGMVQRENVRFLLDIPDIKVAGKTGTAQNPHGMDHGWFTSFAPAEDPKIVVTVLVENGGFGSMSAAPIASLMIESYLSGDIKRLHVLNHVATYVPVQNSAPRSNEND